MGHHLVHQTPHVIRGERAELEFEGAGIGHDAERGAATHNPGMGGGVKHVIKRIACLITRARWELKL
jgi:hypothetical protein